MEIHLAESGGCWKAYMDPRPKIREREHDCSMELYLAGISGSIRGAMEDSMDVYRAGSEGRMKMLSGGLDLGTVRDIRENNVFTGTSILQSYYYCDEFTTEVVLPVVRNFMLDSGAFTFMTQSHKGQGIDWERYVRNYARFIRDNGIKLFFELDIDSIVGYDRVRELRTLLEKEADAPCIPVWHKSRGKDEFLKLCKEYDYVAIGGIVSKEITKEQYPMFPWFIEKAHRENARIHGLGFTVIQDLPKYHFDSVDSTSWVTGNKFGYIWKFDGTTVRKHEPPPGFKLGDAKRVAVNNFKEWVKFQEYARVNL